MRHEQISGLSTQLVNYTFPADNAAKLGYMRFWMDNFQNILPTYSTATGIYPTREPYSDSFLGRTATADVLIEFIESSISHLAAGKQLTRGGRTSTYSSLYTIPDSKSGCPPPWIDMPTEVQESIVASGVDAVGSYPMPPQTKVKAIKFVLDGRSGSTASVVPTQAYTYGLASVVTFGAGNARLRCRES